MDLIQMGKDSKHASIQIGSMTTEEKNHCLSCVSNALKEHSKHILTANEKDMIVAKGQGMHQGLLDRLFLNHSRLDAIADSILDICKLPDPCNHILSTYKKDNGLVIEKVTVPFGVIGIIYESRPNVTVDAFSLCFKAGSAVILKGGKDALHTNIAFVEVIQNTLRQLGISPNAIQLITDTNRETVTKFMQLKKYVDVLIPRGGAGLIQSVLENSTIPVIETGTGNCHIFVDETADIPMALSIITNAKAQRIGVCNACESLVIHRSIANQLLPQLVEVLQPFHVELRGDNEACHYSESILPATEDDFYTEYLDYKLSIKIVGSIDEAISHINEHNTKHSEAIITSNTDHAQQFLNEIDAATVYVNASTRFTDGGEFGLGAEIGISTQKLHARGPMGLEALTTTKYKIYGTGQIR